MVCPRCQEAGLMKIRFKQTGGIAYTCEFCEALWFGGEKISAFGAKELRSFTQDEDVEYMVDDVESTDQDSRRTYYDPLNY